MSSEGDERFTWLHLSDLHVGAKRQRELWPRFKTLFYDDLSRRAKSFEKIDVIIFSGDLTQSGSANEYEELDSFLTEMYAKVDWKGNEPKLISTPGNHDLVWGKSASPEVVALKQYWNDTDLRDAIWTEDGAAYRDFLTKSFEAYSSWRASAIERGWHHKPATTGSLPGDSAYQVEFSGGNAGVICLNSAWLQLGPANYEGGHLQQPSTSLA